RYNVRGVPFRRPREAPNIRNLPARANVLFMCALWTTGKFLEFAPAGLPVRDLLLAILDRMPVAAGAKHDLRITGQTLQKGTCSRLVEVDWECVAALLDTLVTQLAEWELGERDRAHEDWEEQREAQREKSARELRRIRTPVPFWYDRHQYHFPYRQSLLL